MGDTMTRDSFVSGLSRIAALIFALAAVIAIALAIAPSTAQAGGPIPTVSPEEAGDVNVSIVGDTRQYTATAYEGWTFDHWVIRGEGGEYWKNGNPYTAQEAENVTTAVFKKSKQDWTGTTSIDSSADYGNAPRYHKTRRFCSCTVSFACKAAFQRNKACKHRHCYSHRPCYELFQELNYSAHIIP